MLSVLFFPNPKHFLPNKTELQARPFTGPRKMKQQVLLEDWWELTRQQCVNGVDRVKMKGKSTTQGLQIQHRPKADQHMLTQDSMPVQLKTPQNKIQMQLVQFLPKSCLF